MSTVNGRRGRCVVSDVTRRRIPVVIFVWLLLSAVAAVAAVDATSTRLPNFGTNPFRSTRTLVIPHGGGDGLFPENTMLAFKRTMAMGADVVDVDLRMSADGVLVAFHDDSVKRITGADGRVGAIPLADLQALDAGWGFRTGGTFPFRGKGVRIPTLESLLRRFPSTLLSLDLKDESFAMVDPLCALLRSYGRRADVFVGSNSDEQIFRFRADCPDVRTSATLADVFETRDARASNDPSFVPKATVDQPPYRINGRVLVDDASLAYAHRHGIAILTWVVNDRKDMERLVALGVDGIYTSYPDRLLEVIKKAEAKKSRR